MRLARLDVFLLPVAVQLIASQQAPVLLVTVCLRLQEALRRQDNLLVGVLLIVTESLQRLAYITQRQL